MQKKLYSGPVLVLGAIQLIEFIAYSITFSYFPHYAISLGSSVASVGLFTSSFMLMAALLSPVFGGLSDKAGRKKLMLLGLIGDVIFGTLSGLAPSWEWLLLIRTLNGAVSGAATISAQALLVDLVPKNRRGEAMGFVMACGTIGRNIGPVFGGFIQWRSEAEGLSLLDSYRIPYFVDAALAVLAVLLVWWKIKGDRITVVSEQKSETRTEKVEISLSLKILFVCAMITGVGVGFIMPISALFYTDKFGAKPFEIGLIMSLSGFVGLFVGWIAGKISDKVGRKPMIALGGYSSRLATIALPFTADLGQASLLMPIQGLGFSVDRTGKEALLADLAPVRARGRIFGLYRTFFDIGDIIGPIMATYLYSVYRLETFQVTNLIIPGYAITFFVNAFLGLISTTILLLFVKEPERAQRE